MKRPAHGRDAPPHPPAAGVLVPSPAEHRGSTFWPLLVALAAVLVAMAVIRYG